MSDAEKGEYRSLLTQRGIQPESFPVQQQPDCKSRPHDWHVCHAFAMSLLEVEGLQDFFYRVHIYHHNISHHLGRPEPKYDATKCCPWWPCLPCGTAIMYSFMLVGLVLLSTVSLLAGILCCLPWSETQLNQMKRSKHITNHI